MPIPPHFLTHKSDRPLLVQQYELEPLRRFQCLRPIPALYKPVEDIAYQFEAKRRGAGPDEKFNFYTGHSSGDDFLRLLGRSLPPLQTWEVIAAPTGQNRGNQQGGQPGANAAGLHPLNAQLLSLLNVFFLKHTFDPLKPSASIFRNINAAPNVPQHSAAVAFNSIMARMNETAADLHTWLVSQAIGRPIRPFATDLLEAHLVAVSQVPSRY